MTYEEKERILHLSKRLLKGRQVRSSMAKTGSRVTIKDLASICNVSTATVSRVLNHIKGGYSGETEARILRAAEEMGYAPNPMARSLVTRKTSLVAVLVPDIHYYFFQEFFAGLEEHLNDYGYRLLLCNTQEDSGQEELFIRGLCNGLVDGIIVSTLNNKEQNDLLVELDRERFPIITLERYGEDLGDLCCVQIDNFEAGRMAVDHLYSQGHRRIAFIKGKREAKNAEIRYQGYLAGLRENGLEPDKSIVRYGDYSFASATKAMEELLETGGFTALVAANDLMTLGACKAITKAGRRIPEDISVLGLDRTILTDTHEPSIVAIDFCAHEIGHTVGKCMMAMINNQPLEEKVIRQNPVFHSGKSIRLIQG